MKNSLIMKKLIKKIKIKNIISMIVVIRIYSKLSQNFIKLTINSKNYKITKEISKGV